ncbi:Tex family protein [Acetoanaerobium sticklandii]|uniref:Tex family protein n=1 Tax=Acetoanaerobium sticklandii TaxID=1511 RepID=UPI003A926FEA
MDIVKILQQEFNLKPFQVENTLALIDEGKTIPFIARYRKEQTGEMTDTVLRQFDERLKYLKNLTERKEQVERLIEEQGKLTEELQKSLELATTLQEVEDIYAPFKQKKRTRATVAREKGLEPLSEILVLGQKDVYKEAENFLDEEKGVASIEDAIAGAMDIVAETIADDFELKKKLRAIVFREAVLETSAKKGSEKKEDFLVYKMYHEYSELCSKMPAHRVLAVNRGEKEDILKVKLNYPLEKITEVSERAYVKSDIHKSVMADTIKDSLNRLMLPSLERELRTSITEMAEERAIAVFGENLRNLLMQSPLYGKTVLGWDPAYRTGCKIAVVDETGKVLDTTTVYPTVPQNKVAETKKEILKLIDKHNIDIIAIGNGTASRESEAIVADIVKESSRKVSFIIVSEAGASVYSASALGEEELPELNVSIRGAVSIARRLQDPLSELVKIDPEHIGVGQYQHDVNQKRLSEVLTGIVEDSVNRVGVDLNTASYAILSYVAGINKTIAKNIIKYRDENGKFSTRKQLLKVARLGPAAYEQCAGFLRVKESGEVLDRTGVHPESYKAAYALLEKMGISKEDAQYPEKTEFTSKVEELSLRDIAQELEIGLPTLRDIVKELSKPGRDIRDEGAMAPILRSDILKLEDLEIGMILQGTVRNVVDFGAFVDIGIKNDGLVHISQLSDKYVKNPMEVVSVGDVVEVRVIDIDRQRGKVSLSMKKA